MWKLSRFLSMTSQHPSSSSNTFLLSFLLYVELFRLLGNWHFFRIPHASHSIMKNWIVCWTFTILRRWWQNIFIAGDEEGLLIYRYIALLNSGLGDDADDVLTFLTAFWAMYFFRFMFFGDKSKNFSLPSNTHCMNVLDDIQNLQFWTRKVMTNFSYKFKIKVPCLHDFSAKTTYNVIRSKMIPHELKWNI